MKSRSSRSPTDTTTAAPTMKKGELKNTHKDEREDEDEEKFHKLARNLANPTDAVLRERSIKVLYRWFSTPKASTFSKERMLKIWKGLFYCMWFSDKPLVQQELAERLASLLHAFKGTDAVFLFVEAFYETMQREWAGLDRLRLDKFYSLQRKVLFQVFTFLSSKEWDHSFVKRLCSILSRTVLVPLPHRFASVGLSGHLIDIFLVELQKAITTSIDHATLVLLIQPFVKLLSQGTAERTIAVRIKREIFGALINLKLEEEQEEAEEADGEAEEKNSNGEEKKGKLAYDVNEMQNYIFDLASSQQTKTKHRPLLYSIYVKFKYLNNPDLESDPSTDHHDTEETEDRSSLTSTQNKKRKQSVVVVDSSKKEEALNDVNTNGDALPLPKTSTRKNKKQRKERKQEEEEERSTAEEERPTAEEETMESLAPESPPRTLLKPSLKSPELKKGGGGVGHVHFSPVLCEKRIIPKMSALLSSSSTSSPAPPTRTTRLTKKNRK